jgi:hypothetical protein
LVDVLEPQLVGRNDDDKIPHTFRPGRICLHLREEWDATTYIHQTIVPWASLWLYYYELWQATGEWLGGGHEPQEVTSSCGPGNPDDGQIGVPDTQCNSEGCVQHDGDTPSTP